jgi:predicted phage baseplate assembly protein
VHPVRLTRTGHGDADPVGDDGHGVPITRIAWDPADALPFPLAVSLPGGGQPGTASGNVVLADHGHTGTPEPLSLPVRENAPDQRAQLTRTGLTWREDHPADAVQHPASALLHREPRHAVSALRVTGTDESGREVTWVPRPDLLASDRIVPHLVVEMEDDGTAYLRFGDGVHGRRVAAGDRLTATYRVGNGTAGNVGRAALAHLAALTGAARADAELSRIVSVTNPLPAAGGTDPEPIERVRLLAPHSFMEQQRCVVEEDFVRVAESHPQVRRATASFRWTGSWHTAVVIVDRDGGLPVDTGFHDELMAWFEPYRLTGGDLDIRGPRPVPVDIVVEVGVADGHRAAGVERDLLAAFGTGTRPDGTPAFFNPVNVTVGQPLYLSQVVACAAASPGVAWADVVRFQRSGQVAGQEIDLGVLTVGPQEVLHVLPGDVAFVLTGGN